ncbi:hypothetical protein EDC01DRAFT_621722 [Geopyxis carbonaria]|nr:hypothetical protein EDC01DRAFT_621722 [Geopyxis carbonaria]
MPSLQPYNTITESKHCKLSWSVTYEDAFGPIFTENRYKCPSIASVKSRRSHASQEPLIVPAPYDRLHGQRGADPMVGARGSLKTPAQDYEQQLLAATQEHKTTIASYGCDLLPNAKRLDEHRYSNLFWAIRELHNQTCLDSGEVSEFVDIRRPWTADWRFTIANRGEDSTCEWFYETGNVAEALHYYCFYTGLGVGENSGGIEAVSWGKSEEKKGDVRWCMRYSERGWEEPLFEKYCLGI